MVLDAEVMEMKKTVAPMESSQAGAGGGEGDRAAIHSEEDSLIHLLLRNYLGSSYSVSPDCVGLKMLRSGSWRSRTLRQFTEEHV